MVNVVRMCATVNLAINWNRIENFAFRFAAKDACMETVLNLMYVLAIPAIS